LERYLARITEKMEVPENTEVHVVGTYGRDNIEVSVSRENVPIVLVLLSQNHAFWDIKKTENSNIVGVILSGRKNQSIKGLDDNTKILKFIQAERIGRSVFPAYSRGKDTHKFHQMVNAVKAVTGKEITSYQGEGNGSVFEISDAKVFAYDNAFAFHPDYNFPKGTEVHVVSANVDKSNYAAAARRYHKGSKSSKTINLNLEENKNSIVLVLTSENPIIWNIINKNNTNIKGIILSGSLQQDIKGDVSPKTGIIRQLIVVKEYNSEEYKEINDKIKNMTGLAVSSFRSEEKGNEVTIKRGNYFPKK